MTRQITASAFPVVAAVTAGALDHRPNGRRAGAQVETAAPPPKRQSWPGGPAHIGTAASDDRRSRTAARPGPPGSRESESVARGGIAPGSGGHGAAVHEGASLPRVDSEASSVRLLLPRDRSRLAANPGMRDEGRRGSVRQRNAFRVFHEPSEPVAFQGLPCRRRDSNPRHADYDSG
jgi:hypothetical protein